MQLSSVVLPEPLGPHQTDDLPGKHLHSMSMQRVDPRRSRAEMLGEVFDPHDRLPSVSAIVLPRR